MAGFRRIFINNVSPLSRRIPTKLLIALSNQKLIFPFYHTISNKSVPHICHLYPIKDSKTFSADLEFLLKHYQPLDLEQLKNVVQHEKQPKKPSFFLSFDDGLREFYDIAAPILKQKGIPAICFLNSDFINNKNLFYRYKVSLLIEHLLKHPMLLEDKSVNDWLETNNIKEGNVSSQLLAISYNEKGLIDELANRMEFDFHSYLLKNQPYLTSEQIIRLKNDGFYFGAHSVDHPEYQHLNYAEQLKQTTESIDHICSEFNLNYKAFSFPFTDYGVSKRFFNTLGENDNILFFGCAGQKKESRPTHFQRIPFETDNHLTAREILHGELLYYLLKAPLGKNYIKRN